MPTHIPHSPLLGKLYVDQDLEDQDYRFVNPDGTVAGAGEQAAGILLDDLEDYSATDAARTIDIQIGKECVVIAGGTISRGDRCKSDANGAAVVAASTDQALVIASHDAVAGNHLGCLWQPIIVA